MGRTCWTDDDDEHERRNYIVAELYGRIAACALSAVQSCQLNLINKLIRYYCVGSSLNRQLRVFILSFILLSSFFLHFFIIFFILSFINPYVYYYFYSSHFMYTIYMYIPISLLIFIFTSSSSLFIFICHINDILYTQARRWCTIQIYTWTNRVLTYWRQPSHILLCAQWWCSHTYVYMW